MFLLGIFEFLKFVRNCGSLLGVFGIFFENLSNTFLKLELLLINLILCVFVFL